MSKLFCNTFFDAFMSGSDVKRELVNLIDYMSKFYPHIYHIFSDFTDFTKIIDTFTKIGKFFSIPFKVVERNGVDEIVKDMTFGQVFTELKTMNVHQNIIDDNGKQYSCGFHEEELFDHLIMSGLIACVNAIKMGIDPFISALSGILHDIGKPGCIHLFSKGYVGYPYHGEFGALILSRIYSSSFETFISKDSWELICRLITIHMCSYHLTTFTSDWEQARINSTRIENDSTKKYLMALSYGDVLSAVSKLTSYDDFLQSRDEYFSEISKPFICSKKKIVITVDGLTNSGKSTVADILMSFFSNNNISYGYIARDNVMCNLVMGMQNLSLKNSRPTADEYADCYTYYKKNGLSKIVNKNMLNAIRDSCNSNTVTIIDTQMTLFKHSSSIFPSNISDYIIISIDVNRNHITIDDKKNGIGLNDQLTLSGSSTFLKPFDVKSMDIYRLQSKFCNKNEDLTCVGGVDFKFQVCSNSEFYGSNSIGLNTFKDIFQRIYSMIDTSTSSSHSLDNLNLTDLVNHVYKTVNKDYDKLTEFFRTKAYQCSCPVDFRDTSYSKRIIHLKYLDHNNNWNKWGRDTRGTGFYLNDDEHWIPVKYLMQRGAEMLTGMQIKRGITDTENINLSADYRCSHLSAEQQGLIINLATGNKVNIKASFKKDGSLHAFVLYSGEFAKIMRDVINTKGDKFTKTVMNIWDSITGSTDYTFVFQSQGTMLLGNFMQDYATTALFPIAEPKLTPIDKLKKYGPDLFRRLGKMFDSMNGDFKLILAETICANRLESYSGKVHNELAVSYTESGFTILSRTSITGNTYKVEPHYEFSELIHSNGFNEPAFWNVTTVEMMDNLIKAVDSYIFGNLSISEFYCQFPPSNKFGYEQVIDVEGFVVYDLDNFNSYGKIKTDSYYKAHKLRENNVSFLCDLALVAGHLFPLAHKVRTIYVGLDSKLKIINSKLIELITSDLMVNALNEKARKSYLTKDKATQFKIIINTARAPFCNNAIPFFVEQFGQIAVTEDTKSLIVNYAMKCEIWRDVPLTPPDEFRSFLISAMVGSS
jgi:hypothetical protein